MPRKRAVRRRDRGVNFLLAGVQKAGTSTLFALISDHPQVATPRSKELHFFSDDRLDWENPDYESYLGKIRWRAESVVAGEGTPRYLFWPGAMERIRAYNPDMRIILSFRDPIERAFSHWAMTKAGKEAQPDFTDTIQDVWATRWPRTGTEAGRGKARTIVSRGYYGQQLEHAFGLFDRGQFVLLDYHRVFWDLADTLDRIATLLGVDAFPQMPTDEKHVRPVAQQLVARPPSGDDVSALAELYAADLAQFADTSGLDVSAWPTARVIAGALDPADLAATLAARAHLVVPDPARTSEPGANRLRRRQRQAAPTEDGARPAGGTPP